MTDYFVKNGGNDAASGLDDDNAWETLSEVSTGPGPGYSAGDSVYLKKDDEWRETLTPPSSGSSGNPITFGSYGAGSADPIINGADVVETWTETPGSWSTDWSISPSSSSSGSGDFQTRTVWPCGTTGSKIRITLNAAATEDALIDGTGIGIRSGETCDYTVEGTRITWDTGSHTTTVTQNTTKVSDDMTYSVTDGISYLVHVWYDDGKSYKYISDSEIQYHDSTDPNSDFSTIADGTFANEDGIVRGLEKVEVYSDPPANVWQAALGAEPNQVFIDGTRGNKQTALVDVDSANDWYWAANVLYIYYTEDPDDSAVIEVSVRDYCVTLWYAAFSYINFSNLNLQKADNSCFIISTDDNDNNHIIIDSCEISGSYLQGIACSNNNQHYITISNNNIHDNRENGIYLGTSSNPLDGIDNFSVHNNLITDNGYFDATPEPHGRGIYLQYVSSSDFYSNFFKNARAGAFKISEESDDNRIYYNLVYQEDANLKGALVYTEEEGTAPDGNEVYNNVFYMAQSGYVTTAHGIYMYVDVTNNIHKNNIIYSVDPCVSINDTQVNYDGWNNVFGNNCYYRASGDEFKYSNGTETFAEWQAHGAGYDANGMATNPLMIAPANDDFKLAMNSPCIDAGTQISYIGIDSISSTTGDLTVVSP